VDFASKLELVMKVLSLSRGGLAAAMGVDKSVAGRWVSGSVKPSSHNLAKLSQVIAKDIPGFTMLDWERDAEDFAALVGVQTGTTLQPSKTIWPLLPERLAADARHAAKELTRAYEGLWRTTRPSSDVPGQFLQDVAIVRRDENGFLSFRIGVEGFYYSGSAVMVHNQLYYFAADDAFGAISFGILNGVQRGRADIIDGLILTTLRDAGGSPAASGIVMHRIGSLTDDEAADDATFAHLVENQKLLAQEGSVPNEVVEHLHALANAPGMLRMLFATSQARGPLVTDGLEGPIG
jgi:hypothetical protein